jgi:hypothetical protein
MLVAAVGLRRHRHPRQLKNEMPENNKHAVWIGVARTAVSAIVAAGAVIFFFGGREAKINDIVNWKSETAPIIKRMDTTGTLSFDLFHKEYLRTQERQEKKLEGLEQEIRILERHWNDTYERKTDYISTGRDSHDPSSTGSNTQGR